MLHNSHPSIREFVFPFDIPFPHEVLAGCREAFALRIFCISYVQFGLRIAHLSICAFGIRIAVCNLLHICACR